MSGLEGGDGVKNYVLNVEGLLYCDEVNAWEGG